MIDVDLKEEKRLVAQSGQQQFDLVVVGAGPGGYVAAIRAAQLGMRTAIVEREHLGGVCLNWGCIPTKSLLKSAEVYQTLLNADAYGLAFSGAGFDLKQVVQRSRDVAARLRSGVEGLMAKNRVQVFTGNGWLQSPGVVEVTHADDTRSVLQAPHIIFATGASPREIPGVRADGKVIWTAREAMTPEALPESLLVIGAGAIGIEFASFYRTFGTAVTVIESLDAILPQEDADISAAAQRSLKKRGISFHTGARVESVDVSDTSATVCWTDSSGESRSEQFDRVILAVGVAANTQGLGLVEQGVKLERGQVVVDEWCRTSVDGVYAIGDMTAPPLLAHKASHEAVICVEKIAGVAGVEPLDPMSVPRCTYSSPQVASVGLTEEQARAQGLSVRVGKFDLRGLGKAHAVGEMDGLVKTVFDDDSGELLGAHMIGPAVTELIQGYVVAKNLETTEQELMDTVFAHPTLSEAMHESVLDAFDQAIHA
ncbi:dihydrolipoyl dehydrogenase [Microbulbifer sp. SA54]|uniref:dihydrolipoyl dehydrogenase n=1 Tax=Microbulbifer sp. SA54 TaxID=3401577 RepID=UPI003AAFDCC2